MFPQRRMRRRRTRHIQPLLRECSLTKNDLIAPLFVNETISSPRPIDAMPGQFNYPVSGIAAVAADLWKRGIRAVLLFGIPKVKDPEACSAHDALGLDRDKPIPMEKKQAAANSDNPHTAAMGRMAVAMAGWSHKGKKK